MLFIFLVLALLTVIYLYVQKIYKYWDERGFVSLPGVFPFGSFREFGTKIPTHVGLNNYYEKFKGKTPALGIYFFFSPSLLIIDLELLKNIYIRDFTSFHDRGFYSNKKTDPLSCNLLTLEGQEWKDHRTKLSPVFTTGKIKMMFDLVDSIGDKFVKAIDKELNKTSVFEIRELMAKFSTDVISNIAFGIDSNCLEDPNSEFLKMGKRLFNLSSYEMMRLLFTSSSPEGGRMLGMVANPKEPCDFLRRVFTETLKERELKGTQRNDFVQLLFKLRETVPLSLDEMAAEAFIFFAGGFETSSSTLTFLLFELAQSHEIQQRMRREIQDGIEANDGKLTYDLLFNFEYLDMVVKEALRKYPIIPAMSRKCTQEYKIPDTDLIIEKGRKVLIPIYSIQHDPEYYPDPETFDPERFSRRNSEVRDPMTFLTFGEGPHICIGARFAMLQMKIALVKILSNFEVKVCDQTKIPLEFVSSSPFLAPVGGMLLEIKRIN